MHLVWSSLWGLLLRLTASAPHVDKLPVFLWMHRSYSLGTSVRYLQLLLLNIIVILLQKCLGWDRAMQPNIGAWETSFHHSVGQDEPSRLTSQCWIATLLFSGISIPTRIGSFPTPSHGNSLKECQWMSGIWNQIFCTIVWPKQWLCTSLYGWWYPFGTCSWVPKLFTFCIYRHVKIGSLHLLVQ